MDRLRFGTAGIPITSPEHDTVKGIRYVRELGLECMELEFVRQVNISKEKAPLVKEAAKKNDIKLTCHAPYFINLNSQEKEKVGASRGRILRSAEIAALCGARSVTFHAAYYMGQEVEKVYLKVKGEMKKILERMGEEGIRIELRPETTGKGGQWGTVKEIVRLGQELEGVGICVDFAHLFARSIGKLNSLEGFRKILEEIEKGLGREALNRMHIHMSGIEYGLKGERNHLVLKESEFNYKSVLKALKEFKCGGVVISESPNIEVDGLLMQKEYRGVEQGS